MLASLRELAGRNQVLTSLIGMGYYGTITPPVILRNVLENPAWYTAYTPYQPEITQGRLEALLNFQTMVSDLTGMDLANASLLDEATAAAEAMAMAHRLAKAPASVFVVDADTHPQTHRRAADPGRAARHRGRRRRRSTASRCRTAASASSSPTRARRAGCATGAAGRRRSTTPAASSSWRRDLLALVLLRPPGRWAPTSWSARRSASACRWGSAARTPPSSPPASRRALAARPPRRRRSDTAGRPALRLALQTREQHIRREKATSNICTAQVLLAVIAGMYAA